MNEHGLYEILKNKNLEEWGWSIKSILNTSKFKVIDWVNKQFIKCCGPAISEVRLMFCINLVGYLFNVNNNFLINTNIFSHCISKDFFSSEQYYKTMYAVLTFFGMPDIHRGQIKSVSLLHRMLIKNNGNYFNVFYSNKSSNTHGKHSFHLVKNELCELFQSSRHYAVNKYVPDDKFGVNHSHNISLIWFSAVTDDVLTIDDMGNSTFSSFLYFKDIEKKNNIPYDLEAAPELINDNIVSVREILNKKYINNYIFNSGAKRQLDKFSKYLLSDTANVCVNSKKIITDYLKYAVRLSYLTSNNGIITKYGVDWSLSIILLSLRNLENNVLKNLKLDKINKNASATLSKIIEMIKFKKHRLSDNSITLRNVKRFMRPHTLDEIMTSIDYLVKHKKIKTIDRAKGSVEIELLTG